MTFDYKKVNLRKFLAILFLLLSCYALLNVTYREAEATTKAEDEEFEQKIGSDIAANEQQLQALNKEIAGKAAVGDIVLVWTGVTKSNIEHHNIEVWRGAKLVHGFGMDKHGNIVAFKHNLVPTHAQLNAKSSWLNPLSWPSFNAPSAQQYLIQPGAGGTNSSFTHEPHAVAGAFPKSVPPPSGGPTPPPSGGSTPPPSGGPTPSPSGGPTPSPSGGPTPPPSGGPTPPPSGGPTPSPSGGPTPPPSGGPTPPPSGGSTPPPSGGPTPSPSGGPTPPITPSMSTKPKASIAQPSCRWSLFKPTTWFCTPRPESIVTRPLETKLKESSETKSKSQKRYRVKEDGQIIEE